MNTQKFKWNYIQKLTYTNLSGIISSVVFVKKLYPLNLSHTLRIIFNNQIEIKAREKKWTFSHELSMRPQQICRARILWVSC